MKPRINPGNPTPSKFGIGMLNPKDGKEVMFDDCQRRSGILFDYKGPTYAELLQKGIGFSVLIKLANQALRQAASSEGRPIVWIFEEKEVMDFVKDVFDKSDKLRGKIQFDYEPMPGFSI